MPLYDLIKSQSDIVWLSQLRHRANPSIVVSASTVIVVSLLSCIYDSAQGVVRIIMQFLGPNAADCEGGRWMLDELLALTRQLKVKEETIAAKDETVAALTQNNNSLTQTIAHITAPATSNKRSKPSS